MKSLNIRGKRRKNEQYHSYKGEVGKVTENILNRDFTASKPFEKLTTDVTQFKVCNDKGNVARAYGQITRRSNANLSLRPGLAIPACRIPKVFKRTQHNSKYVKKG